ncbi:hypothetical protein [Flavobacterium granuli]|uniref:Lipocalin-like domain-containing protein n=1 Tax=Flavobacterium granuli TaxID=280093 RepID=A0ABU1RXW9_9FLAO|nr:hypothetical protein [Flavobacterium granuli]MDR6843611.1 hypothetical protein [Flavobacterium granuli]
MKNIYILFLVILCISCNDNDDPEIIDGVVINENVDVYLKNSAGENILGTDKYPENSISIKYLIGGKEFGYGYNSTGAILDNPKGFFIEKLSEQETGKGMRIFLNADSSEDYPITYLRWNETETDILKAKYKRMGGSVLLEKLWLNDVLVLGVEGQTTRYITIVK